MGICRTRFSKDIVTEFLPACRLHSRRVLIFCAGMPGVPGKDETLEFWAKKGYWVFFPRYRGTWESGGNFLAASPEKDILDVVSAISKKPFRDIWSGRSFRVHPKSVAVIGTSFGGAAAILAARDPRVTRAIAISPVVDWKAEDRADPLEHLYRILREGYGEAYRVSRQNWKKLRTGRFYNPVNHIEELDPAKLLIFHARDDRVVRPGPVSKFARKLGCSFIFLKKGGHLSSSLLSESRYFRRVSSFLKS